MFRFLWDKSCEYNVLESTCLDSLQEAWVGYHVGVTSILQNNIQLNQTSYLHQQFRKSCVFHLLGKEILRANMNVIQDIFSLLCGVIVPLMILYFLMSRTAMQREPVENDERPVLASRTTTNEERRWTSENISLSIQPSRNFPTEHDERYDWSMTPLATD